jgi:hypothetical protein
MKKPILGFVQMSLLIGFLGATNQAQASPQASDPVKGAIIKEITAYFDQFKGACFADETFSIGKPEIFAAKIGEKINEIIVGQQGAAEIAKMAPKSLGYHNAGEYGLFWKAAWVQLVFSFDPQTIKPGEAGYTNRQTMAHELTHHIEWLIGRKELSKIVDPKTKKKIDNPRSERNTNYQDQVVNRLWDLMILEDPKKINPSRKSKTSRESISPIMGESIRDWQEIETELGKLQKGSSAGNHPPDKDLKALTGFNVELENIQKRYLNGKCGDHLQDMAELSLKLPNINPRLDISENSGTKPGDKLRVKATLVNGDNQELKVPEELKPKFIWTKPDGKDSYDNPIDLAPSPEGDLEVPVKLVISFNEKEYVIARTTHTLKAGDYSLSIDPVTLDGEPNKPYPFTAKADSPPSGARYEWSVDGTRTQSNTSTRYEASFKSEGSHKVSVKLVDSAGKESPEAQAAVTITSGSKSVLHVDLSVLDNLRPNQTFTLTATVENIPASVSKLVFGWNCTGNKFLPSDAPVEKINAWYLQRVTPVNGKATCSITLKEDYFQPPGQKVYSSPKQKLVLIVQDEPYKKIVNHLADKDYLVKQ